MTIIDKIEKAPQSVTDTQVEHLAREAYTAGTVVKRTGDTYLRILTARCQAKLGAVRKGPGRKAAIPKDAQLSVLEDAHEKLYAAVLRGVTTPEVADEEGLEGPERSRRSLARNARSAFARQSKSVLVMYINAGGDLRALALKEVTKTSLRAFAAPTLQPAGDPVERSEVAFIKAVQAQARGDPDKARETIERAMEKLQLLLDGLEEEEPETTIAGRRNIRTRVGQPQLHRAATVEA